MKKTLSLLLVLAMVLTSFTAVFAADETEKTPGEILQEIGVLKGNAEGDLMLDKEVSRQDIVVLLSRLLGQEDEAKAFTGETTFKDIEDPYYVPYIAWAQANELTNGVAEGGEAFGFGRSVTQQEVLAFLLRALGYGFDEVEFENVAAKAAELKLIDDAKADLTVASTREVLAELSLKALKTKVKDSDKTLAEKLELTLPEAEKLEVKEVVADNLKEVKVVLNKSVDEESAVDLNNYDLEGEDIEDAVYTAEDHTVILTVKDELENKEDYTLTIDGVKDDKTVLDVSKDFTALDNAVPEVVEVVGLGTKAVKVVMSEPINGAKASSFKIDGKTVSGTIQAAGRDIIVKTYSAISVGDHELTVGQLKDYNDFKSVESKHSFTVVEDKDAPEVSDAVATALERVVLTFSEDVDSTTVNTKTVYWKNGSTKVYPEEVKRLAGNKYAFTFEADDALPVYETTLYITGVKDYSGNTMADAEKAVKPSIDDSRPVVRSVDVDDSKTIIVKFSKPVNTDKSGDDSYKDSALNPNNYKITDSDDNKQAISDIAAKDSNKVIEITLGKALDETEDYTIKISGIKDRNKYANYMVDYTESLGVKGINSPELTGVAIKNSGDDHTIYLYFSKDMDLDTVSNPENYLVEIDGSSNKLLSAIKGSEVEVVTSNGRTVKLTFELEDKKPTGVAGLGLKDTSGNTLKNYGKIVKPVAINTISITATAKSKTKIVVEFKTVNDKGEKVKLALDPDKTKESAFITDKTQDDVTISENKVTIDLTKDLNADPNDNSVTIDPENVYLYEGTRLSELKDSDGNLIYGKDDIVFGDDRTSEDNKIGDEISPSLVKVATSDPEVNGNNVEIILTFDEGLATVTSDTWKSDLIVEAVSATNDPDNSKLILNGVDGHSEQLKLLIPTSEIDVDETAFLIGVKENARFITDKSDNLNLADETDPLLRTKVVKIKDAKDQSAVEEEAAKITAATVDVTGAKVDYTKAKISEGYTPSVATSDKVDVIALDGTINKGAEPVEVTLTFRVKNDKTEKTAVTKEIIVTVPVDSGLADQTAVNAAKADLNFDVIKKDNTAENNILGNLNLVTSLPGHEGVAISWRSDKTNVIANDGTVTRPESDTAVTLTATLSKNDKTATQSFSLIVKAQ